MLAGSPAHALATLLGSRGTRVFQRLSGSTRGPERSRPVRKPVRSSSVRSSSARSSWGHSSSCSARRTHASAGSRASCSRSYRRDRSRRPSRSSWARAHSRPAPAHSRPARAHSRWAREHSSSARGHSSSIRNSRTNRASGSRPTGDRATRRRRHLASSWLQETRRLPRQGSKSVVAWGGLLQHR